MKPHKIDLSSRLARKKRHRAVKLALLAGVGLFVLNLIFNIGIKLPLNTSKPADAILVLGGSIQREIDAARLGKYYPDIPIIISSGSEEPCMLLIFQKFQLKLDRIWLEKCADSTFGNFFYSVPILQGWGVHKVIVITSPSHLPRAKWLAQIHLGAKGIASDIVVTQEQGFSGNYESGLITFLDVSRSFLWAIVGQFIYPSCSRVISLDKVDFLPGNQQKVNCKNPGNINF
ncbi:protein of unknown function DUF218 [Gloeothece citriformis PCC 7424]|uniref:DUF218 domain-containing protein n=1 Tax=Gloeothece citriformis (strain PCC 7424) TaxID=65393 RepID=B7KII0_GLOC7|nr:YdcF family protein [Gloeothece citriformis]ACK69386.1 protein of unknown function DUF218 [Gloeothece citriformis PCC 7424]